MNGRTAIESSAACGRAGAESGDALLVTVTRCGAGARAGASCPAPKATQAVTAITKPLYSKVRRGDCTRGTATPAGIRSETTTLDPTPLSPARNRARNTRIGCEIFLSRCSPNSSNATSSLPRPWVADALGDANAAGLSQRLEPCRDVHALAPHVAAID